LKRRIDFAERRPEAREQKRACFSGCHAAGGAMEKPHAQSFLEASYSIAQSRGANAGFACGVSKATGLGYRDKCIEFR
jgi:hypothetical protein